MMANVYQWRYGSRTTITNTKYVVMNTQSHRSWLQFQSNYKVIESVLIHQIQVSGPVIGHRFAITRGRVMSAVTFVYIEQLFNIWSFFMFNMWKKEYRCRTDEVVNLYNVGTNTCLGSCFTCTNSPFARGYVLVVIVITCQSYWKPRGCITNVGQMLAFTK